MSDSDQDSEAEVEPRPGQVEADRAAGRRIGEVQQVQRQQHRHQAEGDADQLVGQVEPGTVWGYRGIQGGGLLGQAAPRASAAQ